MKSLKLSVAVMTMMLVSPTAMAGFVDVPTSHPNFDAIEYVQSQGIVQGYSDLTFRPDNPINRAEFTKMIVESIFDDYTIDNCLVGCTEPDVYADVNKSEWYSNYICVGKYNRDIINGYPDRTFRPGQNINFVEASKIIVTAFKYGFSSDPIWYKPYVEVLGSKKAIPVSIKNFDHKITRAEMAEVIYRLHNAPNLPSLTYSDLD